MGTWVILISAIGGVAALGIVLQLIALTRTATSDRQLAELEIFWDLNRSDESGPSMEPRKPR